MRQLIVISVASFLAMVTAQGGAPATNASTNPCAILSQAAKTQTSGFPKATPTFIPSLVQACQDDVPINDTLAATHVAWMMNFLQFQSTIDLLRNPPRQYGYDLPAADLIGGLQNVMSKAASGAYKNELQFEQDINSVLITASEGHLGFETYLIGGYQYYRSGVLVSVSTDGVALPKVYMLSDVVANATSSASISAVVSIDSMSITEFTAPIEEASLYQDRDARYNSLFYNPGKPQAGNGTFSYLAGQLGPDTTTYGFENGTQITLKNYMKTSDPVTYDSGIDLFNQHLTPSRKGQGNASSSISTSSSAWKSGAPSSATPTTPKASSTAVPIGYPTPTVAASDFAVAGYFLKDPDTAVLQIPTFDTKDAVDFQTSVTKFIAACRHANKSRLIIDVRGNGGGVIYLAYDLFKQLFPTLGTPFSQYRFRATEYSNAIGSVWSTQAINFTVDQLDPARIPINDLSAWLSWATSPFSAMVDLKSPDGVPYGTWPEFYGPHTVSGDNFTSLASHRFDNQLVDYAQGVGSIISGYANNTMIAPSPFAPENITLITDGACGSTCAIWANLLVRQAHVRTIVAGGRPSTDPMALIGGTQGGEIIYFPSITQASAAAIEVASNDSHFNKADVQKLKDTLAPLLLPPPISPYEYENGLTCSVNLLDNIAMGDTVQQIPEQFVKTYADCRVFYKPADVLNVTGLWDRVVDGLKGNGDGLCVNGSVPAWSGKETSGGGVYGSGATGFPFGAIKVSLLGTFGAMVTAVVITGVGW